MKSLWALIVARNKEFYRDRSAMIWTLMFPFIVLAGFNFGYSGRQDPILRVLVTPSTAKENATFRALGEAPGISVVAGDDEAGALKKLERYQTDLVASVVDVEGGARIVYWISADSDKGKLAERLLKDVHKTSSTANTKLESRSITGRRVKYADWLLPGLLAMNIMFGSMFGVGYVIVRYRKNGVLKRLRATPLSAFQFLLAQVVSRMALMVVTSFMVIGGARVLIGFKTQGSLLDLTWFLCVSSAAMIALGLIVAARIATEEVAEGVLNLMTWPMIFLSGIWFSIEGASTWVIGTAQLMPLTHVVDGLRAIMIDGASLGQVSSQAFVLLGLGLVFLVIGSAVFRWR